MAYSPYAVKLKIDGDNRDKRCFNQFTLTATLTFYNVVELPRHFVLIPTIPITVQQGQEAKVICESEGVSVTKLKWKIQTTKGDVSVQDNMVTVDKDRSNNRVRATLTIQNAQPKDSGVYKCVLMVFNKTEYKQTTILVKGIFNRP